MDEVARQLPSTLGHTPPESEEEVGTSLRDLRDESKTRQGHRNNDRNTHATKTKVVDKLSLGRDDEGRGEDLRRAVLAPPVRPRDVHDVRRHEDADGEGPPSDHEAVHVDVVGRRC